ncbi:MAG: 3-deoxy-manno-octulosonate cytidylyltransferase [Pseudomonadales bacterium]
MAFSVIIPARFGSTRFPGKPLVEIAGVSMVRRVYEQAQQSDAQKIVVATDDERIFNEVKAFGGEVCMTRTDHLSGTDRLQEVVAQYGFTEDEIVVNVQGDEPMIPPALINQVAANLADNSSAAISTLSEAIESVETLLDPNAVKVLSDVNGMALYFSRAAIPWPRDAFAASKQQMPQGFAWQRHIGIYAYRVAFLHKYVTWPSAAIEQVESLEQLRALYQGEKIHVAEACQAQPAGIDTPEDLARLERLLSAK